MATSRKSTKNEPQAAGAATEGLKVIARSPKGIRRAGRHWGPEETTVSLAELTPEQLELLEDEPQLVTVRVELAAPADESPSA